MAENEFTDEQAAQSEDAETGDAETGDAETEEWTPDIPEEAVDEAERLTRLARNAAEEGEAALYRERRDDLVARHDYTPRIREEDDTLVLYPSEWVEDGTVQFDRIEDTDRAVEVSLSGPGDAEHWEETETHNAALVDEVAAEYGEAHAANARRFADFMSNHYAKPVEKATAGEVEEFLTEYYTRNTWPTAEEKSVVEESVRLLFATAGAEFPGTTGSR